MDTKTRSSQSTLRVLIVAEHASAKFGGEAVLPLHTFNRLRARGIDAWLVVHERTRAELEHILPHEIRNIHFIPDSRLTKWMDKVGRYFPAQLSYFSFGFISRIRTQLIARRLVRRL